MKKKIRMFTNIAMVVLLPMLMAYSLIGERFHEIIGSVMFVLFILHHILNRNWYGSIFKSKPAGEISSELGRHDGIYHDYINRKKKFTARRIVQIILDVLLFVYMILQPVSGILMSKHLYTFINVGGISAQTREIHLFLAYWGFVLLCIHAGMHLQALCRRLCRKNRTAFTCMVVAASAISAYGVYAFVKRGLIEYMFRRTAFVFFDFSGPTIWFFLDYLAMMILFASFGCVLITFLSRQKRG